jgi:hypothetical protein
VSLRSAHFDAFKAQLVSVLPGSFAVYDTQAPLNTDGTVVQGSYVVIHDLGRQRFSDERFTAATVADSGAIFRYVVRAVGKSPFACREVADAVLAVTGKTFTVAGRYLFPVVCDDAEDEPHADPPDKPLVWFADTDFIVTSRRT